MDEARHMRELAIATLAAGIIAARKAITVQEIQAAWADATMIAFSPGPSNAAFKEWQISHGITPTTPEEDAARTEANRERNARNTRARSVAMRRGS